ncbi:MAG: hypothetical protein IKU13_01305, partial [Clostridia bacterium]|nr:hypothetical protein [Clostridia bacterium]
EAVAKSNTSPIYIDNVKTNFEAYTINQNNYFKLRDVALVLRGTSKQFNVTWNTDFTYTVDGVVKKGAIDMKSRTGYLPVGGEMKVGDGKEKAAVLNYAPMLKDGVQVDSVTGYTINQNNFFKLRDLGALFDFNVSWDGSRNAIIINTNESYDPSN